MLGIGDTHSITVLIAMLIKEGKTYQNYIHVGDLGLGFKDVVSDIKDLQKLDEILVDLNSKLYVIRGNHDNPIFWTWNGIKLPKLYNIDLVSDYSIKYIEDRSVLFVGGATSIDRLPRLPELSWWPNEEFEYAEERLQVSINRLKNMFKTTSLDLVVTHTAPDFSYPRGFNKLVDSYIDLEKKHGFMGRDLSEDLIRERELVTEMYNKLVNEGYDPKKWIYGHFHSSKTENINNTEFVLLNINEIKSI